MTTPAELPPPVQQPGQSNGAFLAAQRLWLAQRELRLAVFRRRMAIALTPDASRRLALVEQWAPLMSQEVYLDERARALGPQQPGDLP